MLVLESACKYKWIFTHLPTTHLPLCGPVPSKPQTGTSLYSPRVGDPCPTIILFLSVFPFWSISICLLYLDALILSEYIFIIVFDIKFTQMFHYFFTHDILKDNKFYNIIMICFKWCLGNLLTCNSFSLISFECIYSSQS